MISSKKQKQHQQQGTETTKNTQHFDKFECCCGFIIWKKMVSLIDTIDAAAEAQKQRSAAAAVAATSSGANVAAGGVKSTSGVALTASGKPKEKRRWVTEPFHRKKQNTSNKYKHCLRLLPMWSVWWAVCYCISVLLSFFFSSSGCCYCRCRQRQRRVSLSTAIAYFVWRRGIKLLGLCTNCTLHWHSWYPTLKLEFHLAM